MLQAGCQSTSGAPAVMPTFRQQGKRRGEASALTPPASFPDSSQKLRVALLLVPYWLELVTLLHPKLLEGEEYILSPMSKEGRKLEISVGISEVSNS